MSQPPLTFVYHQPQDQTTTLLQERNHLADAPDTGNAKQDDSSVYATDTVSLRTSSDSLPLLLTTNHCS